jgi:hypothetical protein
MHCRIAGLVLVLNLALLQASAIPANQQTHGQQTDNFYGLYYADWDGPEPNSVALVISSDGKPIAPKVNDPDAPTQPGFHIGQQHFQFESSRLSAQRFSFRTVSMGGTQFSFHGRFGREPVDTVPRVPYIEGVLTETRNGRVVRTKKVHFGHAVVL